MDRHVLRHFLFVHQLVDEAFALLRVVDVKLVADFALLVLRAMQESGGAGRAALIGDLVSDQPGLLEDEIKLPDPARIEKIQDGEFLIGALRMALVIEPDRDIIADDSPLRIGELIEIVPALLDRRAVASILFVIEISAGAFEFDDCRGGDRLAGDEQAKRAVGDPGAGDGGVFFAMVVAGGFGDGFIVERFAEDFLEEMPSRVVSF